MKRITTLSVVPIASSLPDGGAEAPDPLLEVLHVSLELLHDATAVGKMVIRLAFCLEVCCVVNQGSVVKQKTFGKGTHHED